MTTEQTCAERIESHKNSRLSDFGALNDLASVWDTARLDEVLEDSATREVFDELTSDAAFHLTGDDPAESVDLDALRERAQERIHETPLSVSALTVFRVDLSTGGPADWLEVVCSGDTPLYEIGGEPYAIERIVYHFADWFDHAETTLEDVEFDTAAEFARQLVPELVE